MSNGTTVGVKVALCQTKIEWENKQKNIFNAEKLIVEAVKNDAQIVLFPEMSFTGFSMDIVKTREADMQTVTNISKLASEHGVYIGFGWVKESGDKAENHYTVVDKSGAIVLDYTKIHSFQYGGEGEQFIPGGQLYSFIVNGFCFTPLICYDLRFPEVFRMKMEETDVYIVPANWPASRSEHWNTLLKARAIENQSYVLGINCVGEIGGLLYNGDTSAIDPSGNIIGHVSGKEEILYVDIEKSSLDVREAFPVRKDRRQEIYLGGEKKQKNAVKVRTIGEILNSKIILFWGAGAQSANCVQYIREQTDAEMHIFDSAEEKVGLSVGGLVVEERKKFQEYLKKDECVIIISSINYQYSISKMLVDNYNITADMLYGYTDEYYEKNIFQKEYTDNLRKEIESVWSKIEDRESQEYFDASIRYRFNRNPLELMPNSKMKRNGEYADIVRVHENDIIVDCGAYTGDTAEMYCDYVNDRCIVYAFEPFRESFCQLEKNIREKGKRNVYAFNCAVSNENRKDIICFDNDDFKMGMIIGEKGKRNEEIIDVRTIDSILGECESIDFIKMDIEGEEMNALAGAANIIKKFAPDMMISAYHKFEHILQIPQFLREINPNYRIFVGHAPNVSLEIEIYATVKR